MKKLNYQPNEIARSSVKAVIKEYRGDHALYRSAVFFEAI